MAEKLMLDWVVVKAPAGMAPAADPGFGGPGVAPAGRMPDLELVAARNPTAESAWSRGIQDFTRANASTRARGSRGTENLELAAEKMTTDEARETLSDTRVLGLAPRMHFKLIKLGPREQKAASQQLKAGWGIEAVGATTSPHDGDGVTVAVLDTGIDPNHKAFAGVNLIRQNFSGDASPDDEEGHGTHCAGTIFGRDVDGVRIGVAPGVKTAIIGKVLGRSGGSTESIVNGIHWAQSQGADVISMSLGMDFPGYRQYLVKGKGVPELQATSLALSAYRLNIQLFEKLAAAIAGVQGLLAGSVVTAATGNESRHPTYSILVAPPAAADGVVSVAALQPGAQPGSYALASFSNVGGRIAAPGVDIWSAKPKGGLTAMSGTSMATPHVAGVAALWWQHLTQQPGAGDVGAADVVREMTMACQPLHPAIPRNDVAWGLARAPQ